MALRNYLRWLRYKAHNRKAIMGLRYTTTWKCDSKCVTCAIWQDPNAGRNDLSLGEIDCFSKSRYFRKLEYITLSGGEPTTREDLSEVISILHKNIPTAVFAITTHGMHPDLEENLFRKVLKENSDISFRLVGLSLNGPPEIHDATRGIKGSWNKTIETYNRLKDLVHCEFSFTFCRLNAEYFEWVQNFAKENGTNVYICWTVMNERFNVANRDLIFWEPGMEKVLLKYLESAYCLPKTNRERIKAFFKPSRCIAFAALYDSIIHKKIMPCYAGSQIVHIDPQGYVYPCNFKLTEDRRLGNLREKGFDQIWENVPKSILKEISQGECMYPNGLCGDSDIFPSLCNCPPYLIKWYLKKLLAVKPLIEARKNNA